MIPCLHPPLFHLDCILKKLVRFNVEVKVKELFQSSYVQQFLWVTDGSSTHLRQLFPLREESVVNLRIAKGTTGPVL